MDLAKIRASLEPAQNLVLDIYERRPGKYQLILPILHEDADMVDIYLQESPCGEDYIRVCDFGMTLMRLSYTFDINTDTRRRVFDSILINNGIRNDDDNLYLDIPLNMLQEGILQFAGCVQKVCNMRFWRREVVHSAFYDDLKAYITSDLTEYQPLADQYPVADYLIGVDWQLTHNQRNFYLFGVLGNDKAKNVAIALLEFQKAKLPFISLVVHENMEALGIRERRYLTNNADTQYSALSEFCDKGKQDIRRLATV